MDFERIGLRLNAQGDQACLAQARQDRPGIGELDLTEELIEKPDRSPGGDQLAMSLVRASNKKKIAALKTYQVWLMFTDDSAGRLGYRDRPGLQEAGMTISTHPIEHPHER